MTCIVLEVTWPSSAVVRPGRAGMMRNEPLATQLMKHATSHPRSYQLDLLAWSAIQKPVRSV